RLEVMECSRSILAVSGSLPPPVRESGRQNSANSFSLPGSRRPWREQSAVAKLRDDLASGGGGRTLGNKDVGREPLCDRTGHHLRWLGDRQPEYLEMIAFPVAVAVALAEVLDRVEEFG